MTMFQNSKLYLKNLFGKKTRRKIVAIHIDDFGSIRVRDVQARETLRTLGFPMSSSRYSNWDTLCTSEDLQLMFEVLCSVKDQFGHPACVTPFANVANPNFEKIRESNFTEYHRETFVDTFRRLGKAYDGAYELWKQGISENIFHPEYHGTEHLCVRRFMRALQENHKSTRLAFDHECVCLNSLDGDERRPYLGAVFNIERPEDNEPLKDYIRDGIKIFQDTLGYCPKQFTPGNGAHSLVLMPTLYECGIRYVDASLRMASPLGNGKWERHFYWNGKVDSIGMKYLIRNCVFEPFLDDCSANSNAVPLCLASVEAAFTMHAPAIISTHRVNFTGGIDKAHRDESLTKLKTVLQEIVKRWPEVEFMDSSRMADEIL